MAKGAATAPWSDGNALYLRLCTCQNLSSCTVKVCAFYYTSTKKLISRNGLWRQTDLCVLRSPSLSKQPWACFAPLENGDAMGVVGIK